MLRIAFNVGVLNTQIIEVEGTQNDDLLAVIEDYVMTHKDEFACYTLEEILTEYNYSEDEILDEFLPINGGEFYIGKVEWVEEF